jgi:predicted dehydrogenase
VEQQAPTTRVLVVGLGRISRTHLDVLARTPDATVVGGVDPAGGEHPFPVHTDLETALETTTPDLVVVATPTDTHVDLVTTLLTTTRARVLSEKPLARTHADVLRLSAVAGVAGRLTVAHHFAFSPEVEWARQTVQRHPEWGPPTRVLSVFNDAYAGLPEERRASYVSTWVDSGPNQLSLLAPFVGRVRAVAHDDEGVRAHTVLEHAGGRTTLLSNWVAADTSKQTVLSYLDGAVQLRLDHTSMTATVLHHGEVVEHVGYTGSDSRKEAHYVGLYRSVLGHRRDERTSLELAAAIAEVLESATALGSPGAAPTWSTTSSRDWES